jgi:hypothetical protein
MGVDDTHLSAAVWRPAEHWQTEDESVEWCMKMYRALGRMPLYGVGMLLLLVLPGFLMSSVRAVAVLCLLAGIGLTAVAIAWHLLVGRWLPAAGQLLADSPRQRIEAVVVGHRRSGTTLAVGSMYLRVRLFHWGLRQVVARSGEITLVGPDDKGNAVVFVDGQPTPLPAEVVMAPELSEPEPPARVSWRGAEDDVPQWYAAWLVRLRWIAVAGAVLPIPAFAYDAQQPMVVIVRPEISGTASFIWFYAISFAVLALCALYLAVGQRRLTKLLGAGQWQGYPATVLRWRGEPRRPHADLMLRLHLPDGASMPVLVKHASVQLMANVNVTGTLWMIGTPKAGKLTAVGVPGHPIVATARFS